MTYIYMYIYIYKPEPVVVTSVPEAFKSFIAAKIFMCGIIRDSKWRAARCLKKTNSNDTKNSKETKKTSNETKNGKETKKIVAKKIVKRQKNSTETNKTNQPRREALSYTAHILGVFF